MDSSSTSPKITFRKPRHRRSNSLTDSMLLRNKSNTVGRDSLESLFNSTLLETPTNQSLPTNITSQDTTIVDEVRCQIEQLNYELTAANNEIDNLILQNLEQNSKIEEYDRKIKLLLKITRLDVLDHIDTLAKRNDNRLSLQPQKYYRNINMYKIGVPRLSFGKCTGSMINNMEKSYNIAANLSTQLDVSPIAKSNCNLQNENTENFHHDMGTIILTDKEEFIVETAAVKDVQRRSKNNMLILSANNKNDILRTAQNMYDENFKICHFCKPNANVCDLIENLDEKVKNFTKQDYCIVFIGESDFKTSKNYVEIINYLREAIQGIKHTNIILGLPTYKIGSFYNMFNWRVEMFNNLLYQDNFQHKYVSLFDCNYNLQYDFTMFQKRGQLNNHGLLNIFCSLYDFVIKYENKCDKTTTVTDTTSNNFFRQ